MAQKARKTAKKTAKKPARKQASKERKSAKTPEDRIIDTALRLAAERGWRDLSLAEIAEEAGVPISVAYPLFASKQAILDAFSRRIDAIMLAGDLPKEEEGRARDRLFDVVMQRFDALEPYRASLANILHDQLRDPFAAVCSWPSLSRSLALILEAAGLSAEGMRGLVRMKGLAAVYLASLRVWLRDESEDKSQTMAALDSYLRRIETCADRFATMRRGEKTAGT